LTSSKDFMTFSPNILIDDDLAAFWLRQVTIRLRREICWCWHERGILPNTEFFNYTILPPFTDELKISLNQIKFTNQKKQFFETDKTASYLTEQLQGISLPTIAKDEKLIRGSFSWIVNKLNLDDSSSFILALGLLNSFDNSSASIISACLNDPQKTYPNFVLARKLWDMPEQLLTFADPQWQLFRLGLLQSYSNNNNMKNIYSEMNLETPFGVSTIIAHHILFPTSPLPWMLHSVIEKESITATEKTSLIASRIKSDNIINNRIIPIYGKKQSSDFLSIVSDIANAANRKVVEFVDDPSSLFFDRGYFLNILTLCWLKGFDLFLGNEFSSLFLSSDIGIADKNSFSMISLLPVNIFIGINDLNQLKNIPNNLLLPIVNVPNLSYEGRIDYWRKALDKKVEGLDDIILEMSRRFHFEKKSINSVCEGLNNMDSVSYKDFINICRAESEIDFGDLAQKYTPRFTNEKLILPQKQLLQFQEIFTSIKSLLKTCYGWQMAKTDKERGITVLFAGNSGTGKSMAAELLAVDLDLPMYKMDLSQVINKYVGETEKHLKKLFDMADTSDIILFFDEADSLFGRRTEVKDAHDRFANMEINYLLERLDNFKGLLILATNRKKDFDEAFLRRINYILDFPFPSEQQRKLIWRQVIPNSMDSSNIDFDFLSKQFQLTGGNIRSIVSNACLQSAKKSSSKDLTKDALTMDKIIIATKREYEKYNRSISIDQFGKYSEIVINMDSL